MGQKLPQEFPQAAHKLCVAEKNPKMTLFHFEVKRYLSLSLGAAIANQLEFA